MKSARVALVHDWLVRWGGSESVLRSLCNLFPEAPIYTAIWRPDSRVRRTFDHRDIRTTFLQPFATGPGGYKKLLPLMPVAFRALDLSSFDFVMSSSHSFAKAVRVGGNAVHVCYCHTPPRYIWDLQEEYLSLPARILAFPLLLALRRADLRAGESVDQFVANSHFVASRIERIYGRDATVVHPPVDVEAFGLKGDVPVGDYYLSGGRMVGYKRLDLAIRAANQGGFKLVVFGEGPEESNLRRIAGPSVEFVGAVEDGELAQLIGGCRGLIFPGIEDFGILPAEVQAAGRPVIALGRGGARETVVDGCTGVLFNEQTPEAIVGAIRRLRSLNITPGDCVQNAGRFSRARFEREIRDVCRRQLANSIPQ